MAEYKVGSLGNLISGTSSSNAGSTIIYEEVIPNWNAARIVKQSGDDCLGSTNTSGVSTLNGKRKNIKNKIARSFLSKKKPEIAGDDISFNIAKSWRHLPPSEKDFEVDGENSFSRNAARRVHIKNNSKKHVNDPEREAKTVFVGNIPYAHAKKKKIAKFFSQYGDVESVRFRCAPLKDPRMSKKVAVIKHDFHPDRSSICSYVVFRTAKEAKSALQANGLIYHDHHLRVDLAVNASSRDVDSKKSVFIGNLAFSAEEEDLWQLFSSCGAIESVRIVRDPITAVSKGIAFVNFEASDGAELALQLDGSDVRKRKLSVKRHRNFAKQSSEVLPSKRVVWHKDTNQIENNGKDKRKTMEEEIRLIKKDKRRMRREGEKLLGIKKKKSSSSKFVESKLDLPENNPEHGRSGVVEVGEKNGPKVRKKSGKMLGTAKKKKTVNGVVDEALSGVSALIPLEPEPKELRIPKSSFKNMKYQGQTVEESQKKKKKINKGELKKKKMAQMLTIGLKKKEKNQSKGMKLLT